VPVASSTVNFNHWLTQRRLQNSRRSRDISDSRLTDRVKVLRPTRHKIRHFGAFFQAISWLGMEKQN